MASESHAIRLLSQIQHPNTAIPIKALPLPLPASPVTDLDPGLRSNDSTTHPIQRPHLLHHQRYSQGLEVHHRRHYHRHHRRLPPSAWLPFSHGLMISGGQNGHGIFEDGIAGEGCQNIEGQLMARINHQIMAVGTTHHSPILAFEQLNLFFQIRHSSLQDGDFFKRIPIHIRDSPR